MFFLALGLVLLGIFGLWLAVYGLFSILTYVLTVAALGRMQRLWGWLRHPSLSLMLIGAHREKVRDLVKRRIVELKALVKVIPGGIAEEKLGPSSYHRLLRFLAETQAPQALYVRPVDVHRRNAETSPAGMWDEPSLLPQQYLPLEGESYATELHESTMPLAGLERLEERLSQETGRAATPLLSTYDRPRCVEISNQVVPGSIADEPEANEKRARSILLPPGSLSIYTGPVASAA